MSEWIKICLKTPYVQSRLEVVEEPQIRSIGVESYCRVQKR